MSVWDETLGEEGKKIETKRAIIATHDMSYEGKARGLQLQKKLNGTHILTFSMPSSFFDNMRGEWVHNEFCDYLFNERKLKLKYRANDKSEDEWLEFYVKSINESKNHNSIMYDYTCQDAFIDELSRNGYGITFDTELYNNVEEIGTFSEIILEDSIWEYDATKNIGDFTEFTEERLFKIPVKFFKKISGYKIKFNQPADDWPQMTNPYTKETRPMSISDDLARQEQYFWDPYHLGGKGFNLLGEENRIENIENDGYIYVPYNQLDFCYTNCSTIYDPIDYKSTETAAVGTIDGVTSYYLAPSSLNPESLIQFIALPAGAKVKIDEAQLLLNTDYSYVMKVCEWNELVQTSLWYKFETKIRNNKQRKYITDVIYTPFDATEGNRVVAYEGYLNEIGGVELNTAKNISISDRTEINISEDIDQYVTVYNNESLSYYNPDNNENLFSLPAYSKEWGGGYENYRVCSKQDTRQIVPQLARNFIQNGTNISKVDGWEPMCPNGKEVDGKVENLTIGVNVDEVGDTDTVQRSYLQLDTSRLVYFENKERNVMCAINFGIVGQEITIDKNKFYCLKIEAEATPQDDYSVSSSNGTLQILFGNGTLNSIGDYTIDSEYCSITFKGEEQAQDENTIYKFNECLLVSFDHDIKNPYFVIECGNFKTTKIYDVQFFEAYTKGQDFFDDESLIYRYSGRELTGVQLTSTIDSTVVALKSLQYVSLTNGSTPFSTKDILFETDVMEGDTYEYTRYFIQQLRLKSPAAEITPYCDTFLAKEYTSDDVISIKDGQITLPLSALDYTEDDYEIVTNYIDLNKCQFYHLDNLVNKQECDKSGSICLYQRYGYCPYRFQTEKHCRKIRTLNGEKSNRFNLTQELGKVFEVYPIYYIEHTENGKIVVDENKKMIKKLFYMTEKGSENKLGFRYKKNLTNISRTRDSSQIVTKLYVEDVDSEVSKTGLCSIKTAQDNPSKDSFIIDFSYYYLNGMLNKETTEKDLYGENDNDMGYLKSLGYWNTQYDTLSNQIINLQDESYTELEANIEVNLTGIETAMQELNKIKTKMSKYTPPEGKEPSQTYLNYQENYKEQQGILLTLLRDTFSDGENNAYVITGRDEVTNELQIEDTSIDNLMEKYGSENVLPILDLKNLIYDYYPAPVAGHEYGMLAQFLTLHRQIQKLKKIRSSYLKEINRISLKFYRKYEPYLKEGTWTDDNYLTDNAYYHGAMEVAKQGAIPKLTYSISAVDLGALDPDYAINVADTTYVEDEEMFGFNKKTGLPNRLKVIISGITYNLENPGENSLEIQNYTTQFEDLFQQVSASVQSLTFNENIYKRSSNFTATQNIEKNSLQGTLLNEDMTLLQTQENNIVLDSLGQSGSDINNHNNKYQLNGQGLFFSNDGGQHWNVGVGPGGINADYIKVGTLDAGKIRIVDSSYVYFLWDKRGITAYRNPQQNISGQTIDNPLGDYCQFNKNGLSVFEQDKIKLRAGYDIVKDVNGKLTDLQGENIGFFLYDDNMNTIFSTTSGKAENGETNDKSARLSLMGEIFATNGVAVDSSNYVYSGPVGECVSQSFNEYTNDGQRANASLTLLGISQSQFQTLKDQLKNNGNNENGEITLNGETPEIKLNYKRTEKTINWVYIWDTSKNTHLIHKTVNVIEYTVTNNGGSVTFIKFDNEIYISLGAQTHWIVIGNAITPQYVTSLQPKTINTYLTIESQAYGDVVYKENNGTDIYLFPSTNEHYHAFARKNPQVDSSITGPYNTVGVFINNRNVGTNAQITGNNRVLSCVLGSANSPRNEFANLLTITDGGLLQIGGTVTTTDGSSCILSDLPNQVNLQGSDAIQCVNGNVYLGGMNIGGVLSELQGIISSIQGDLTEYVRHGNYPVDVTSTITIKGDLVLEDGGSGDYKITEENLNNALEISNNASVNL